MTGTPNGLIVCGPQNDSNLESGIVHLAEALHVPVLAEPLSQLRTGAHSTSHVISTYDALFCDKNFGRTLNQVHVLRFGAMPISKSYRFFIVDNEDVQQFVVEHGDEVREPTNHHSQYIFSDSIHLCEALIPLIKKSK